MAIDVNKAIYGRKYSSLASDSSLEGETKCESQAICNCNFQKKKKIPSGLAGRISAISGTNISNTFASRQIDATIKAYEAVVELNRDAAFMVEYQDSDKIFFCVPMQSKQADRAQFLAFRADVVDSTAFLIEWRFSEQVGSYGEGELTFYDLDSARDIRNVSDMNRLASVVVDTGGGVHLRLTWTHHGGFPSWSSCFRHYSSEPWGIIGYVVSPGATLVGIGLGCL